MCVCVFVSLCFHLPCIASCRLLGSQRQLQDADLVSRSHLMLRHGDDLPDLTGRSNRGSSSQLNCAARSSQLAAHLEVLQTAFHLFLGILDDGHDLLLLSSVLRSFSWLHSFQVIQKRVLKFLEIPEEVPEELCIQVCLGRPLELS